MLLQAIVAYILIVVMVDKHVQPGRLSSSVDFYNEPRCNLRSVWVTHTVYFYLTPPVQTFEYLASKNGSCQFPLKLQQQQLASCLLKYGPASVFISSE